MNIKNLWQFGGDIRAYLFFSRLLNLDPQIFELICSCWRPEEVKEQVAAMDLEGSPSLLKFHMPAEWEPHSQCWMGWPVSLSLFCFHSDPFRVSSLL